MSVPYFDDGQAQIWHGDALDVLPTMELESVDAVVCDPPYDLTSVSRNGSSRVPGAGPFGRHTIGTKTSGFMGKEWDGTGVAFQPETWQAVLRVLKPGGHLLAFGGTRTHHRMMVAIEDAGFEIRDCLMWLYGSGFPKSLDVSKAIDKMVGAEREVVGKRTDGRYAYEFSPASRRSGGIMGNPGRGDPPHGIITSPATDAAKQWDGWGTALKPAYEPIILARKPLIGTVASNVLAHGTGAINIDACRLHSFGSQAKSYTVTRLKPGATLNKTGGNWRPEIDGIDYHGETKDGRWPANIMLDEAAAALLDEQSGERKSGMMQPTHTTATRRIYGRNASRGYTTMETYGDTGGASRFFYVAKASRSERGEDNHHPTVKPISVMRWLCRLVTPPDGFILDPFMGSGSTGCAAVLEGFRFVGIEQEAEYVEIARRRISYWAAQPQQPELFPDMESAV